MQWKSRKPALKNCLVLKKWSGHGHPSPPPPNNRLTSHTDTLPVGVASSACACAYYLLHVNLLACAIIMTSCARPLYMREQFYYASDAPDMYIHTNKNVLKYVRSRLINYYVTSSKWYAAKQAITTVTISISQYCSHVSGNLTSETPSIRDLRECETSPSNMYVYVVMMWHS